MPGEYSGSRRQAELGQRKESPPEAGGDKPFLANHPLTTTLGWLCIRRLCSQGVS